MIRSGGWEGVLECKEYEGLKEAQHWTTVLLTFSARQFVLVGLVLYILGHLAASLTTTY